MKEKKISMAMTDEERRERRKEWDRKYDATHSRTITMKLHIDNDADILARLDTEESKAGFIKMCIRYYIEHEAENNGDDT